MASIFTYQEEPHRVHSPWSTPGSCTPRDVTNGQDADCARNGQVVSRQSTSVFKLEPEKHDGPVEYKLHLLLRWRRVFTYTSTSVPTWKSNDLPSVTNNGTSKSPLDFGSMRSTSKPSMQTRQARLQQLTTQLLWRLQQSSPFHSSSNRDLVLPMLPEAVPRLGVPENPSTLLPGLEESQGALYEIGVADDGTLVGLADDEMDESLNNLRAMAASLGCIVDVHRRISVGDCRWTDADSHGNAATFSSKLWVAEVLVRPENKIADSLQDLSRGADGIFDAIQGQGNTCDPRDTESTGQQFRVALVGSSGAGKSSLLGTLTASVLDDGRGKSRLSLLKHRHEIASGVTSSVAHEFLGYQTAAAAFTPIVNYASGDVSSWPDVHNLADRLVLLSDSPGQPRYAKSTFRALIAWEPTWTVLCIAADDHLQAPQIRDSSESPSLALAHLRMCLELAKPLIVVVTKLDVALKTAVKHVLAHILTAVRGVGRMPLLLNGAGQTAKSGDAGFASWINESVLHAQDDINAKLSSLLPSSPNSVVPIIMTSAVSGYGMTELHATLRALPIPNPSVTEESRHRARTLFRIDEVFAIPPSKVYSGTLQDRDVGDKGVVLCGFLENELIELGDELQLGPFLVETDFIAQSDHLAPRRASSHQTRLAVPSASPNLLDCVSRSLQPHSTRSRAKADATVKFARVRVVSLRNLRLPVSKLHIGATGTVGIQCLDESINLSKARKGMVLFQSTTPPRSSRAFVASFPFTKFDASDSPPLILGGYAMAYIHSARMQVKVTSITIDDSEASRPNTDGRERSDGEADSGMFTFEDGSDDDLQKLLRVSFKLVRTVEYIESGDQVLIVPTPTAPGPITGPVPGSTIAGFSGFVGKVLSTDEVENSDQGRRQT